MENSIEESIERLEKSINDIWFNTIYSQEDKEKDVQVLLSNYKRVLKENKKLKENYICAQACANMVFNKVIPVQKVKDKIKKYKNMCISNVNGDTYFKDDYNELVYIRIERLEKELLESEE